MENSTVIAICIFSFILAVLSYRAHHLIQTEILLDKYEEEEEEEEEEEDEKNEEEYEDEEENEDEDNEDEEEEYEYYEESENRIDKFLSNLFFWGFVFFSVLFLIYLSILIHNVLFA